MVIDNSLILLKTFWKKKRKPGVRWGIDESYMSIKGQCRYYERAVDRDGETVDFLLTVKREKKQH